jgi:hypothetical protein
MADRNKSVQNALGLAIVLLMLAACATSAPGGIVSYQPIAPNRMIVTLTGSTTGTDVQNNVLRRAAEVTLRAGYTHFTLDMENVQSRTYYFPIGDQFLHGPDYGRRAGLWPEYPLVPETHYFGSAEIVMLSPDEAAGNPEAIEAQSVL